MDERGREGGGGGSWRRSIGLRVPKMKLDDSLPDPMWKSVTSLLVAGG